MNKKLKYLSTIPLYGTCILLIYLFILTLKEKISKSRFFKTFIVCAIVSTICYYMVAMMLYIVSKKIINLEFNNLRVIITLIIGGYMMNAFSFKYIDQKWSYLFDSRIIEKKLFLKANQSKIILIGVVLAIVITIFAFVSIFTLGLI